ncbi:MAG: TrkH family potassium uptake protein [Deltaproteobacteria bacterium]|nr:TrkH family potassium uptake protein [Deltaproteobacteria bacterium]
MHFRSTFRFIGILIFFLGASMIAPILFSLFYRDGSATALIYSLIISCVLGLILVFGTKKEEEPLLNHRDGVAIVTLGWLAAGLVGAIPFMISGAIPGFTDAYFESISGFTTTGASILSDIESIPDSILLWRSITQWLGGMGIIVLSIAILPFLGIGGMQLYKAEIPSPVVDKLKPRISDTAKTLWKVYISITVAEIVLLFLGGMPLFEAVYHAFCTMPTGGFSSKNASIAYYNSPYFDGVIIVFMLLAGINFSLHYRMIKGDLAIFAKDPECRVFLTIVGLFILMVNFDLYGNIYHSIASAFRNAAFQVSSIITTTGFVTADFDQWPSFSKTILLLCMFLGAMAGSTGGGIKTMRIILLAKHAYQEMFRIIHPRAVTTVKLGGRVIPEDIMSSIWGFFVLYLGTVVIFTVIMAFLGLDIISAFSSVAACIFNIGPGLGVVGPVKNYFAVPLAGKWILIFCMLLARLEIYTVMVLLIPEYWRK